MNPWYYRVIWGVIGLVAFVGLYGFVPRNFDVFSNNLVRLVENKQHYYAKAYYQKYGQSFRSHKKYSGFDGVFDRTVTLSGVEGSRY